MFYSVFRKYRKHYPEKFLEKFIHNFFWKSIINFGFWGFGSFLFWVFRFPKYRNRFLLRRYKKFFGGFHFLKYKNISWGRYFLFFELWRKSSISWDIRKHNKFFNIRARNFNFRNIRNFLGKDFFYFSNLGWKEHNVAAYYSTTNLMIVLTLEVNLRRQMIPLFSTNISAFTSEIIVLVLKRLQILNSTLYSLWLFKNICLSCEMVH